MPNSCDTWLEALQEQKLRYFEVAHNDKNARVIALASP